MKTTLEPPVPGSFGSNAPSPETPRKGRGQFGFYFFVVASVLSLIYFFVLAFFL